MSVSFQRLADNYSPLFDAYKPFNLVNTGVYATIRHPIYAFNLCVSFGLALSSGEIIEQGDVNEIFASPKMEYTRELLDAIPHLSD